MTGSQASWVGCHSRTREVERALEACADEPAFVGVRHLVNVEPDPDWILRPDVLNGLQVLAARRLTFDYVGILPRHLEHVPLIAQRVPDLRIVIDHLGKPPIGAGDLEHWGSLLARAAQMPNVFAKLSGLDATPPDQKALVSPPLFLVSVASEFAQGGVGCGDDAIASMSEFSLIAICSAM